MPSRNYREGVKKRRKESSRNWQRAGKYDTKEVYEMLKKSMVLILATCFVLTVGVVGQIGARSIQIEFWYHGGPLEVESIEATAKKFEELHPDVDIKLVHVNVGYPEKIRTRIAVGEPPDIAYIYANDWAYLVKAGQLMDLTPLIEKDPDIDIADRLIWWTEEVKGKLMNFGWGTAIEVPCLWYNKDIFNEYGIAYPPATLEQAWTWDEFIEMSRKLTRDKSGNSGISEKFDPLNVEKFGVYATLRPQFLEPYFLSNETSLFTEDMEILIDDPKNIEVLQTLADLMRKYYVMPTPEHERTPFLQNTSAALQSKQVAMYIDGQWDLQELAKADFTLGVGVLPKFKRALAIDFTFSNGIFSKTKDPQMVWEFYKFLGNPEYVLPVIQSGLWMPLDSKWYTDPELIDKWMTEGVHPPEYRTAVIDALWKTAQTMEPYIHWWRKEHQKAVYDIIQPDLDRLWLGKVDAQTIAKDIAKKVRALK